MDLEKLFINNEWLVRIISSFIVIILAMIFYKIIVKVTEKGIEDYKLFNGKKSKTYIKLARSITRYIYYNNSCFIYT